MSVPPANWFDWSETLGANWESALNSMSGFSIPSPVAVAGRGVAQYCHQRRFPLFQKGGFTIEVWVPIEKRCDATKELRAVAGRNLIIDVMVDYLTS
jgi:hypothetical protein